MKRNAKRREIKTEGDATRAREWLMRSVTRAAETKLGQILDFVVAESAKDVKAEREAIIACIRSGSWSGSEEIVAMIRARN